MEIRDNATISSLFQNIKNQTLPQVGEAFMSLLGNKNTNASAKTKPEVDVAPEKPKLANTNKDNFDPKKELNNKEKPEATKEKPSKEKVENNTNKEEKNSTKDEVIQNTESKPTEKLPETKDASTEKLQETIVTDESLETATPAPLTITTSSAPSLAVQAVASPEAVLLPTTSAEAQAPTTSVKAQATAASANSSITTQANTQKTETLATTATSAQIDVSTLEPINAEEDTTLNLNLKATTNNSQATVDIDEAVKIKSPEAAIQAKEIESKIGSEHKLNITTNIEEEGFSFTKPTAPIFTTTQVSEKTEASFKPGNLNPILQNNSEIAPQSQSAVLTPTAAVNMAPINTDEEVAINMSAKDSTISNIAATGFEASRAQKAETAFVEHKQSTQDSLKGMSKEVVDQVKINITKSAVKGVDKIEVHLKPEELGHIEIKMQIKDGKLQAQIIASRPETVEMLQKEAQSLEKSFQDAGFQTDSNSLSFSQRGEENQGQAKQTRLGFMAEALNEEKQINEAAAIQNYDGKSGLNIRV